MDQHPTDSLKNNSYPTAVQTSLPCGASIARYSLCGKFVIGGRPDGGAIIWDLDTKAPIRWLDGHVRAITIVDWSRHSRFVLTSSKDWNIIVWDLASEYDPPSRRNTIRFDAPVLSASFHPRNVQIILALLYTGEVYVEDLRKKYRGRYELIEPIEDGEDEGSPARARSAMTVARFDPSGKLVFVGTAAGYLLVFNTRTKILLARHKLPTAGGMVRGLDFAKSGRRLITNSADRTLRQFNLPSYPYITQEGSFVEQDLEPMCRFNDPINKVAWHAMSYSPDGDWLAGGAADAATHKIYIWDSSSDGQFVTALDGGREPLLDVQWHPSAPAMVSTTNAGNILLWHSPVSERWGAFAGGFEEVDENVEYEEREDEFDIEDENQIAERKMKEEDLEVDVNGTADTEREPRQASYDDDIIWADEEPDDDNAEWRIKLLMDLDPDGTV